MRPKLAHVSKHCVTGSRNTPATPPPPRPPKQPPPPKQQPQPPPKQQQQRLNRSDRLHLTSICTMHYHGVPSLSPPLGEEAWDSDILEYVGDSSVSNLTSNNTGRPPPSPSNGIGQPNPPPINETGRPPPSPINEIG
ncbi:hypothetical protein Pst134EA_032284 [Puccinia striiformis f. sp. tritici]|uniref:uncharacterized protein n=1 Tax=Puccinia striiformis f. sp. tritici TaxID=168172 RepID=UPI0020077DDB|nr:uncharacterized protein Pst134EA_032284 [Puccinia striiformis f. sp. tritici]KAH9441794.1 hypothetical protein Pst134EA_032284 [Puccinia striiformis f. sp. tritici]